MRRSIQLILVAAISALTGAWLLAQTPTKAPVDVQLKNPFGAPTDVKVPVPEGPKAPAEPAAKPAEFASNPPLATTSVEAINLRNKYIELSKKKAPLMKEPDLKREIEMLERQIPELEAWAQADEAVRLLHEVVDKHPNTQAAKSAQEAIQLIEGHGRLVPIREGFRVPRTIPMDEQFRRDAPAFDIPQAKPKDDSSS